MKQHIVIFAVFAILFSTGTVLASDHHEIFMKGWEYYKQEDYAKAERLFRKSLSLMFRDADRGDATALFRLGWMYENGMVFKTDNEEAVFWYRKAAELGDATSQYFLGVMYEDGKGVRKSIEEAVKWYGKAAAQKDESAIDALKRLGKNDSTK